MIQGQFNNTTLCPVAIDRDPIERTRITRIAAPVSPLSTPLSPSGWLEIPHHVWFLLVLRTSPSQPQTFSTMEPSNDER